MSDIVYLGVQVLDSPIQSSKMLRTAYQELCTSTALEGGSSPTSTHEYSTEESSNRTATTDYNEKIILVTLITILAACRTLAHRLDAEGSNQLSHLINTTCILKYYCLIHYMFLVITYNSLSTCIFLICSKQKFLKFNDQ